MKNDFQRHKRSDSIKWAVTGIAIILIIAFLAGVIVAIVTETNPKDWGQIIKDSMNDDKDSGGIVDGDGNVMDDQNEVYAMPAAMAFSANALSNGSENTSVTLKCTFTPDTSTNKNVKWSVAWKNPSSEWANGKTASDYVSVTPSSSGSAVATVTCVEDFGEQIIITATSEDNSSVSKTCTVDYKKQIIGFNGITFENSNGDMTYTLFDNSYSIISPSNSEYDEFMACENEINSISDYSSYTEYLIDVLFNEYNLFKLSNGTLPAKLPGITGLHIAFSVNFSDWLEAYGIDFYSNPYYIDDGFRQIYYEDINEFFENANQIIEGSGDLFLLINSLQGIISLIDDTFAPHVIELLETDEFFTFLKDYESIINKIIADDGDYEVVIDQINSAFSDEELLMENIQLDQVDAGIFDIILQLDFDDGTTYNSGIILDFYNMYVPVKDMDVNQGSIIF